MPRVTANGIQIEYETFGSPSGRPLLLIMGTGGQMIIWSDDLCKDLVESGHYVIRYDHRDVGLSTKIEEAGMPNLMEIIGKVMRNETAIPPYTLDDMADDGVGLLTALGIQKAHICGFSMGGMIAQTIVIRHPSRVLSLISISSNTGNRELPQPKPEVAGLFYTPPPQERVGYIEHTVRRFKGVCAGHGTELARWESSRQVTEPKARRRARASPRGGVWRKSNPKARGDE